jgi:hypothetical protein
MKVEFYNELNGLDIDITDNDIKNILHFDFSTFYPDDKEELGEPIVVQRRDKNGNVKR